MAFRERFGFNDRRVNVFICMLSMLMMFVVASLPFKAKPFGDITFHREARQLALWIKGKAPYESVIITKAPGPILFYTPAYLLAPAKATDNQLWFYGVGLTSILVTIALVLIFRSGCLLFSKGVGLLAVIFFFIFPIQCYYSLGILAEAPAFFSLALAIYGWAIAYNYPDKKDGWIYLILGFWLLILNRPNSMLLPGLGFLIIAYTWLRNKDFFKLYGRKLFISCVCIIALCFGITTLSAEITKGKIEQQNGWLLFYVAHQGRFQFREEPLDLRYWDNLSRADSKDYQNWNTSRYALQEQAKISGQSSNEVYKKFLIDDALAHPFWFLRQFFVKCLYGNIYIINSVKPSAFALGPFVGIAGYWAFILLINSINLAIIVGAVMFLFCEKLLMRYWLLWGIILSLLLFHGLTYMEPRYIFPARAALYLMSAAGWYRFTKIKKITDRIGSWLIPENKYATND